MLQIFQNGILSGAALSDLIDELKVYVTGDNESLGVLERYVKQVNSDTVSQYTANYTQVINQDEGLEFYVYLGNHTAGTRCFCDERYGKYFHKKEVQAWGNGSVMEGLAGGMNCGYPWPGMIKGTSASTIFTYRGGWNCQHQLVPTIATRVPRQVVMRNIDNGNYQPTEKIKLFFGLK